MQSLRMMRSVANLTAVQLQPLQARAPHATTSPLQAPQRGSWSAAPRTAATAAAAAYQTAAMPTSRAPATPMKPRVFTEYAVYKGKGAMCLKAIKPEWQETNAGDISLMRAGTIFLEFAQSDTSAQQSGFGQRKYDWGRKQTFALSPTEMGQLIVQNTFSLIHDPMKGQANEGTVLKSLKGAPPPDGKGGILLQFSVKDPNIQGGQMYVSLPLTDGEMAVIRSIINFVIPRALGFDQVFAAESVAQDPPVNDSPPF